MRLVDTSAWIEWLIGSPVGLRLREEIPEPDNWLVPTIVQLELAKWLRRELDESRADRVLALSSTCHVAPLDSDIAFAAAELCGRHRLATADAIVYATALAHGADLLTCDAHFQGLDGARYFAKTGY
jgi:predicted nucleic acid-binding protein